MTLVVNNLVAKVQAKKDVVEYELITGEMQHIFKVTELTNNPDGTKTVKLKVID